MTLLVVTASNRKYSPGVKALWHSIQRNTPPGEIEFVAFAHGDDDLVKEWEDEGMTVIQNPSFPEGQRFPVGGRWAAGVWDKYPNGMGADCPYTQPAMYSRLLIPQVFPDRERAMWIDADCIVHQSIAEMETFDFQGHPVASAVLDRSRGNWKSWEEKKQDPFTTHATATFLINIPRWNELKITERCIELMNTCEDGEMLGVVQSILLMITKDDFAEYGWEYLEEAKRIIPSSRTKIYHFSVMIPWCEYDMSLKPEIFRQQVKKYWEPYA